MGIQFYVAFKSGTMSLHIWNHTSDLETYLSTYFINGSQFHRTAEDVSHTIKHAATFLNYEQLCGIPISQIDTHLLQTGLQMPLPSPLLVINTHIQKMGGWRRAIFKEYICNELSTYSKGMSMAMKQHFKFKNFATTAGICNKDLS